MPSQIALKEYDRAKAVEYADKWAYFRNPKYYDFSNLGEIAQILPLNVFMQAAVL